MLSYASSISFAHGFSGVLLQKEEDPRKSMHNAYTGSKSWALGSCSDVA